MPDEPTDERSAPTTGIVGRVVGSVVGSVVSPVVDSVDVDDVVERIDVNHLVERLDVDALIEQVDANALIDRIDVDRVLDRIDVNGVLDRVDPDRLLDRVDPDALLDRVDANRLLDRVDANALLDRVDPDALLDRVDVDRVLDRVDVNALVDRAHLDAIIARSTTGVFTRLLDVARTQVIAVDQVAQGIPARLLRGKRREIPPIPGGESDVSDARDMTFSERAVAFQRHAAGSVSRFLAFVLDQFLIGVLFAAGAVLIAGAAQVVFGTEIDADSDRAWVAIVYVIWSFLYVAGSLAATSQTIGKAVLGLMVVGADGTRLSGRQASLRTLIFPLNFVLFGIGFLLGLARRDRRELHDLVARTAVVYAWDAKTAQLRGDVASDQSRR